MILICFLFPYSLLPSPFLIFTLLRSFRFFLSNSSLASFPVSFPDSLVAFSSASFLVPYSFRSLHVCTLLFLFAFLLSYILFLFPSHFSFIFPSLPATLFVISGSSILFLSSLPLSVTLSYSYSWYRQRRTRLGKDWDWLGVVSVLILPPT